MHMPRPFCFCVQAHQWFGNLATLDEWTDLWINEGFASYFEAVLADMYQPGMGYLTNFFAATITEGGFRALYAVSKTVGVQQRCLDTQETPMASDIAK
jgi:aminopeptidase N